MLDRQTRAMVLCGALLLASCGPSDQPEVRRSEVEAIDAVLASAFEPGEPGAAVIALRDDSVVLRKAYGMANLELSVPADPDMVYRIGSITKTFTAAAVMVLKDRGSLSLDDDIGLYLAHTPVSEPPITIRQLLSHTSGIPEMFGESYYGLIEERSYALINDEVEAAEFVKVFIDRELEFDPGDAFRYSNSGYYLLGQIIEAASGQAYDEFVEDAIIEPLQLRHTHYYNNIELIPGRVSSYLDDDTAFIRNPYSSLSGIIVYSAGALMSTVDDLARFESALRSGGLLSDESTEQMFTPAKLNDGATAPVGLAWWIGELVGRKIVYHGGDVYGFSAEVLSVPEEGIFVAILSNNPRKTSRDLEILAKKTAAILYGEPLPEWTEITLPHDQLQKLVGTYKVSEGSVREVIVEGERIFTQRDGGRKIEIHPASTDTFFYDGSLTYLTFETNENGEVVRMVMHRDSGAKESALRVE